MTGSEETSFQRALAFKAYEIEELADVYFFRPLGAVLARVARALRLSPTQLTAAAGVVGIVAGTLLYDERLGLLAFVLLIGHGILDSADGQLARMTGRTSELGRVLDGVAGYATYAAVYVAIAAGFVSRGGSASIVGWAALAAVFNAAQAQLYDYHRTTYMHIVLQGLVPRYDDVAARLPGRWAHVLRLYQSIQRRWIGVHDTVEHAIAVRSRGGIVAQSIRDQYRACFYWPVRGWNLLGDNTRFYAIGLLAWIHHVEWFFAFILLPMNAVLVGLWVWQRRADRRFLRQLPGYQITRLPNSDRLGRFR